MFTVEIKKLSFPKHFNQAKLAKHLGVSRQAVNNWIKGRNKPSEYHVKKLERYKGW